MLMLFWILMFLSVLLLLLPLITSFYSPINRDFSSPFECGFDPYHSSRSPFSLQFFIIAVIFLIFDIEIVVLLPLPMTLMVGVPSMYFIFTMLFVVVLLLGTYYEWWLGTLNWT